MRYARLNAIGLIEFATEKLTEEQLQEGGFLPYEEEEKTSITGRRYSL